MLTFPAGDVCREEALLTLMLTFPTRRRSNQRSGRPGEHALRSGDGEEAMMLTKKLLVSLLVVGLSCTFASSAFIEQGPSYTIQDVINNYNTIPGWEFRALDKVFDDWEVQTIGSIGAAAPDAGEILVVAGYWDSGPYAGEVGLRFNSGWVAGMNQISSSTITFTVDTDPGWMVESTTLYVDLFEADHNSLASISTNIYDEEPGPGVSYIGNGYVFKDGVNGVAQQTDHDPFAGVDKVWVKTGVTANSDNVNGRIAHITEFYQTFGQIPEPATLGLLGFGALALLRRRRRG
jgi:hypothetical protein